MSVDSHCLARTDHHPPDQCLLTKYTSKTIWNSSPSISVQNIWIFLNYQHFWVKIFQQIGRTQTIVGCAVWGRRGLRSRTELITPSLLRPNWWWSTNIPTSISSSWLLLWTPVHINRNCYISTPGCFLPVFLMIRPHIFPPDLKELFLQFP